MRRDGWEISEEYIEKLFPKKDIAIMGYESPIEIVMGQMRMEQENGIYRAVQEQGVFVDKDELLKALRYDRAQYEKGYLNGYRAKASEVARELIAEIDNALHDMAMEYLNAGHPEYFAVCEMVHHKVIAPIEKKYTEGENEN